MDAEELDAYLDRVLIGPKERGPVVLVEPDAAWPERFKRERARIEQALGAVVRRIEHIGSTSVPGLAAKPIVDILVTVLAWNHRSIRVVEWSDLPSRAL